MRTSTPASEGPYPRRPARQSSAFAGSRRSQAHNAIPYAARLSPPPAATAPVKPSERHPRHHALHAAQELADDLGLLVLGFAHLARRRLVAAALTPGFGASSARAMRWFEDLSRVAGSALTSARDAVCRNSDSRDAECRHLSSRGSTGPSPASAQATRPCSAQTTSSKSRAPRAPPESQHRHQPPPGQPSAPSCCTLSVLLPDLSAAFASPATQPASSARPWPARRSAHSGPHRSATARSDSRCRRPCPRDAAPGSIEYSRAHRSAATRLPGR